MLITVTSVVTPEKIMKNENKLYYVYPTHLENIMGRNNLTAAYLLEYWANKGAIPHYGAVVENLRTHASEIFKISKPTSYE